MLTFRTTNIIFGLLLIICLVLNVFQPVPFWIYLLIAFAYLLIVFYGCYFIQSGFFMPVLCRFSTDKKQIVLSFDDGPLPGFTPQILNILDEHRVHALFFCIGKRAKDHGNILKEISNKGHLIGNHSYAHDSFFDFWSVEKMRTDIRNASDAIEAVIGKRPLLFRPPYGVMNPNLRCAIQKENCIPVGWSVRSYDTMAKDENRLLERMIASLKPGAIYLFHDSMEITANLLDLFLKEVKSRSYEVVRLDNVVNLKAYA